MKIISEVAEKSKEPVAGIYNYIMDMKKVFNDIASHVLFDNGTAHFWYDEEGKYYTLVIQQADQYDEETHVYKHPKFWGDEELIDVNDVKLTAKQLYNELKALPDADLKNFYGMNNVFNKFGRDRYR
jgi:hypothetical protein